jgi:hypothetical protein
VNYVIYEKTSTKIVSILRKGRWDLAEFATSGAAKAGFTRLHKAGKIHPDTHAIAGRGEFAKIEKTEVRKGIVGSAGKDFVVGVNTPWSSGPWSESYWCN